MCVWGGGGGGKQNVRAKSRYLIAIVFESCLVALPIYIEQEDHDGVGSLT